MKITRHTPNCLASCKNGNICFNRLKGGNHEKKQRFLRNIKKLTALVLAAAAIVTAYNIPIDKTRTITGFMQDPKKNYNAKNQVKVGTVKITAFKNRLTTEAELDKFRKNMGKKDFRETKLGDIEDEAFFLC